MCNRYETSTEVEIERYWAIGRSNPIRPWPTSVHPRSPGPFIRLQSGRPELLIGEWGLIPPFARTRELRYQTNNARSETVAEKPVFRDAWCKGQRCIIPAAAFDEPCWETGHNVWWRFRRADGAPWGLAGLWNTWVDHQTGELVPSYTMLTINADEHPLMRRMHRPNPKRPVAEQDKRSVIAIKRDDVEQWLAGDAGDAQALLRLAPVEIFDAGPVAS